MTHVRLLARGSFRGRCASKVLVPLYMCLYMCPHTTINVSHTTINVCACYCMCVLIVLYYVSSCYSKGPILCVCHHTSMCVLRLLCVRLPLRVSSYYYVCPHTTMCVLMLLCVLILLHMFPQTTIYVPLAPVHVDRLYMCPHSTIYYKYTHTNTHTHTHTNTHTQYVI